MNSSIYRDLASLKKAAQNAKDVNNALCALNVKEHIAPIYWPVHESILADEYQYYRLPGGRGSGKSSFVALEIVNGIMQDRTGGSNGIVFRRYANTMRESVYSQIAWAIDTLGVNRYWHGNVSPMSWTYKPTGAQILFRGLDDSSKLKSIKPRRGTFKYVWFEEFSELPGENFTRNVLQSVQRGGSNFVIFQSFNPPISGSNWANIYVQRIDPRALTLHTTYRDIPAAWLGDDFIIEAERLKEINERAYRHEYLGEPTGTGGEVFPNLQIRTIPDDEIEGLQYIYSGIDFGFSIDPAVFLRVAYDRKHDVVFILDEIYKRGLSNKALAELIKGKGYAYTGRIIPTGAFNGYVPYREEQTIYCDSAEPKSIADLQENGLNARPCHKYQGSVLYGIRWLQHRTIVIDPARTPHAHKEFSTYEYKTTRDGEFLADVPDENNHTIDACRYSLDELINYRGVSA